MSRDWISVKDQVPPFKEFVEVIYPDSSRINDLKRGFAVYNKDEEGCYWTISSLGLDERDWGGKGFGIKHWRPMVPDLKGRKPFLKVQKSGFSRIYLKKVNK